MSFHCSLYYTIPSPLNSFQHSWGICRLYLGYFDNQNVCIIFGKEAANEEKKMAAPLRTCTFPP